MYCKVMCFVVYLKYEDRKHKSTNAKGTIGAVCHVHYL